MKCFPFMKNKKTTTFKTQFGNYESSALDKLKISSFCPCLGFLSNLYLIQEVIFLKVLSLNICIYLHVFVLQKNWCCGSRLCIFLIKDSKPLPAAGPQMEKTL